MTDIKITQNRITIKFCYEFRNNLFILAQSVQLITRYVSIHFTLCDPQCWTKIF